MFQRVVLCFMLLIGLSMASAPTVINVRGKVTNKTGQPVVGAILTLVTQAIKDTSLTDGMYALTKGNVGVVRQIVPKSQSMNLNGNILELSVPNTSPVKVEIFDVNGKLVHKDVVQHAQGIYRLNIADNTRASNLLVINASIGTQKMTFRYLPLENGSYTVNSSVKSSVSSGSKLAKVMAIADTIKITADKFAPKSIAITSYDTTVNITLDSAGNENVVAVNLDQEKQTFQGFGINATIVKDNKALPWQQLFTSDLTYKDALGLSILRIGMNEKDGGHRNVSTGWETARDTYKAKIIGSCWSAPATMKSNNKTTAGGYLKPANYADWAKMIAEYAAKYKLYAMSIANESDFASCGSGSGEKPCSAPLTDEYESMTYTSKQMVDFVKAARKAFNQYAPDVKMIAPEASLWIHVWSNLSCVDKYKSSDPHGCGCFSNDITDAAELAKCAAKCNSGDGYDYGHWLAKDTAAWNAFDIMGVHQYESQVAYPWPADVTGGKRTKEVWQTEMSGVKYWPEEGPNTHIENGVAVARWIQSGLTIGEASAWCYWWYEAYYQNDNEGLAITQSEPSKIAKRYYTFGNYSRYIRPGHKIVNITGTAKLPAKVILTASKDAAGKVVIVAVNENTTEQPVEIKIAGGTAPSSLTPIVTDKDANWKEGTAISVGADGVLKATLAKMSVTTFVSK